MINNVLTDFANKIRSWQISEDFDPWWLDDVGHLVSGMIIAAVCLAVGLSPTGTVVVYFGLAAVWEAYEYTYNIRPWDPREDWSTTHAVFDTVADTVDGFAGVLIVVFYIF